ncbi:DsbC family protein [Persephonella sp.]
MNIKSFFSILIAFLMVSLPSLAHECEMKKVSPEKMEGKLRSVLGNGKVITVSESPVEGLYEVVIEIRNKRIPVYVDCSMRYLISGEIIDLKEKRSLTREKAMELAKAMESKKAKELEKRLGKKRVEKLKEVLGERITAVNLVDVSKIPKTTVTFGNEKAKYTIYVVDDPECPFCAKFHDEMLKVLDKSKDVKFEIILFPLPFHKHAQTISQRILCEKDPDKQREILEESFEAVKDKNLTKLRKLGKKCDKGKEIIEKHFEFAQEYGIGGTPTLIFPKGVVVSGYMKADKILEIIDALK